MKKNIKGLHDSELPFKKKPGQQLLLRDHPYITSANGLGGWGQKTASFVDVQYYIYADIVDGWVRKSPKIC